MPGIQYKVFLEATVVIQAGKPPGGPIMARIAGLVKAELIEVLTTDLTITEVRKKHIENDFKAVQDIIRPHFRKLISEYVGGALPDVKRDELKESISKKYSEQVQEMFQNLKAKVLTIDDVKPSTVFHSYGEGTGFFSGEGKKDQFSDAFIFECLKPEASAGSPVFIVSNDKDFNVPVEAVEHISLLKDIPELFRKLGLQEEGPEIREFLEENEDVLLDLVDKEMDDWSLEVSDVEDAQILESKVK